MEKTKLSSLGIRVLEESGGCCRRKYNTSAYFLPIKLDFDVIPFLAEFGEPKPSFQKTSLLKIEHPDFTITGVRKISQIRFISRNTNGIIIRDRFEECLVKYITK